MARRTPRRSLRSVISATSLGLVALLLLAFAASYEGLRRATEARAADRVRMEHVDDAVRDLMIALINQEVGLRGYLGGGDRDFLDPYQQGETQERIAWQTLRRELDDDDGLQRPIDALDAAVTTWHRTIADPQRGDRARGPLADLPAALRDGKRQFDLVRARHADVAIALEARKRDLIGSDDARIARIHVMVALGAAIALVVAFLATRYMLRHTAMPLAELARRADAGEPFAAPSDAIAIDEVHALTASLYQLDATVFVREQALAAAHDEAVALTRFGEHVLQLSDESELEDAFVRACHDHVSPQKLHVMVRNASRNRLEVVRPDMPPDEQLTHPILSEPIKCRAVRTLREVSAAAGDPTACHCALGVPTAGSYLCLPMLAAGELVGVTNLQSEHVGHFTAERIRTIQGYAGFTGATLSSLRLIAATRERALRDGLTGAYNRAFLSEYLVKAIAGARRRNTSIAVLMCDLDHFKRVNDEHGHLVGDQAIVAFARCLQAQTRTTDAVVRYGGEEFVVLLVDVTRDGASATAERIRHAVERVTLSHAGVDHGSILRTSIGVAVFPDHGGDDQALLSAADAALYRAKSAGRNRVELARPPA